MEIDSITDEMVNEHLDAVLRASGSGLCYYSMQSVISSMQNAMRRAMLAAIQAKEQS